MNAAHLYIVGRDDFQKIGISRDPKGRMAGIQCGSPDQLIMSFCSEEPLHDAAAVEAYAHWLLREARERGEWFRVSADVALLAVTAAIEAVGQGRRAPFRIAGPGRPPMKVKPILVRLPEGLPERIDSLAGKNRRAEFIREAVEREIKRREKAKPAD